MIITYQNDDRDTVQITTLPDGRYRIWGTHGAKWREWIGEAKDMPSIKQLIDAWIGLSEVVKERI